MGARVGLSIERMKVVSDPILNGLHNAAICSRCGGFIVVEPCFDFRVQRCVQCGDRVDPVILQNRQQGSAGRPKTNKLGHHKKAA
jgi:hypothetical protein